MNDVRKGTERLARVRSAFHMAIVSLFILALAYAILWYAGLFSGLGFHGTLAAILGVTLASLIGVTLMTLLFYSNRSRHDREVHDAAPRRGRSTFDR